jgi:hypothetical protein
MRPLVSACSNDAGLTAKANSEPGSRLWHPSDAATAAVMRAQGGQPCISVGGERNRWAHHGLGGLWPVSNETGRLCDYAFPTQSVEVNEGLTARTARGPSFLAF